MEALKQGSLTLYYEIESEGIVITGGSGIGSILELPGTILGMPVKRVAKKAFLGRAALIKAVFPKTVEVVERWALAQCKNLRQAVFLCEEVTLESGVFDECERLEAVCLGSELVDDMAVLCGALPVRMKAEFLMQAEDIGSREWYLKWDRKLTSFLQEDDEEGYTTLVLCGEEDILRSVPGYIKDRRIEKAALCFIRLRYCQNLSEEHRQVFGDYILKHKKGCATDEAWQALLTQFGDDIAYYELFAGIGGMTAEHMDAMLTDMGTDHAEAKAYLMKYQAEHFGTENIFDAFSL